jgi:hypothetical protein
MDFNKADNLLFYAAYIVDRLQNAFKQQRLIVYTVCPPSADSLDELSYLRAIHLNLKVVATESFHYYITFRYTLPYRAPSKFSSIEVLNSDYQAVRKFKMVDGTPLSALLSTFETFLTDFTTAGPQALPNALPVGS